VTLAEALPVWIRVAALSFGGPAGQIAVMHRILVEEKRWIGEGRFLHALNFCMLLPGPEAQQLATYIGWLMHGTAGGLVAGGLFILPGIVSIMALSWVYVLLGKVGVVASLFFGLKAAVLAIVLEAVLRIGRRALANPVMVALAAAAFVLIFFMGIPFPIIVLGAGLIGTLGGRAGRPEFRVGGGHGKGAAEREAEPRPTLARTLRTAAPWLALWLAPVAALLLALGPGNVFSEIATFFSTMAVVTFGGAYAVLAYVAQEAAGSYHWLQPREMLDGLGMAETTPGPLIMVLQFVGFIAAYRAPGALPPLAAATLGGLLATCPVLPLDLRRRTLCRALAAQPGARRRAGGDHRRRGRRHPQPRRLVRAAHAVPRAAAGPLGPDRPRPADPGEPRPLGAAARGRRHARSLPLQGRHDPDSDRHVGGGCGALSGRDGLKDRAVLDLRQAQGEGRAAVESCRPSAISAGAAARSRAFCAVHCSAGSSVTRKRTAPPSSTAIGRPSR
jgi:chromate transporter